MCNSCQKPRDGFSFQCSEEIYQVVFLRKIVQLAKSFENRKLAELAYSEGKMYCCVIFLKRLLGRPPLPDTCSARGPEVWKFGLIMQLITSTVKDKVQAIFFSKSDTNVAIHVRRISWILVIKDSDISPDLDRRLGLIPVTASLPQIHPVHLALWLWASAISTS